MARIIYAYPVTELQGSIGGVTFQRNSSGTIARLKPNMPMNPSPAQAARQNMLAQLVSTWPTLSDADKLTWQALAVAHPHTTPWGDSKTLNGYQWYLSCNLNLMTVGDPVRSTAPGWTSVPALPAFSLTATLAHLRLQFTPDHDFSGYWAMIYATPPLRQSSIKLRRSNFLIFFWNGAYPGWFDIETWYDPFFNVTWADLFNDSNCTIMVRMTVIQELTGLMSPFTSGLVKLN
jgi:hypothetical protein